MRLELLVKKQLPDGGWPAEEHYYKFLPRFFNADDVDWGDTSQKRMNGWVDCGRALSSQGLRADFSLDVGASSVART